MAMTLAIVDSSTSTVSHTFTSLVVVLCNSISVWSRLCFAWARASSVYKAAASSSRSVHKNTVSMSSPGSNATSIVQEEIEHLHFALSIFAWSGSTNQSRAIPISAVPSMNQYAVWLLPPSALMMAEEMKGPMKPEVLPTQLKRAKKSMDLGPGTTSEIMVTLYEPHAAVWNY